MVSDKQLPAERKEVGKIYFLEAEKFLTKNFLVKITCCSKEFIYPTLILRLTAYLVTAKTVEEYFIQSGQNEYFAQHISIAII